jgi:hypothetical protein
MRDTHREARGTRRKEDGVKGWKREGTRRKEDGVKGWKS